MNKKTHSLLLSIVLLVIALLAPATAQEGFAGQHSLTVISTGGGDGTVTSSPKGINCGPGQTCTGTFSDGKKVTLKAKPNQDSSFAGWAGGGCIGIKTCSVIMDSDLTITATFDLQTPEISLSTDTLEFDTTKGKKVTQTLVISNIGTGNLIVTVSGLEETDFSTSVNSPFTIKPNKSYKLKVTYTPSSSGTVASSAPPTGELEVEPLSGPGEAGIGPSSESEEIRPSAEPPYAGGIKMYIHSNDPTKPWLWVELTELVPLTPPKAMHATITINNYKACGFMVVGPEHGSGTVLLQWNQLTSRYDLPEPVSTAITNVNCTDPIPGTECTLTYAEQGISYQFTGWLDAQLIVLHLSYRVTLPPGTVTTDCPDGSGQQPWAMWGGGAEQLTSSPIEAAMDWTGSHHFHATYPAGCDLAAMCCVIVEFWLSEWVYFY